MAMKKEYLSVDGEIFGEVTGGVVNFYDRDALGSVVAIEDGAGNTVSTIEYKPFGDIRTYTGENPLAAPRRFLWCGTHGYRFNERYAQYTSHYVRARHYSSLQGMWSTVDPVYPSEKAYGYVENKVTVGVDSSGMAPRDTCIVYKCTIRSEKLFHEFACVDGPNGGCSGELFPSFFGGHKYNNYGKGGQTIGNDGKLRNVRCTDIDNADCKVVKRGDCNYAASVCEELKKPADDWNYFGGSFCDGYVRSRLCAGCKVYAPYSQALLQCVCNSCTLGVQGGTTYAVNGLGFFICGVSGQGGVPGLFDPKIAKQVE